MRKTWPLASLLALSTVGAQVQPLNCLQTHANQVKELHVGRQGTVLFDSELQIDWNGWADLARQIAPLSQQLRAKGTQLLLVPVPTRTIVQPELLNLSDPVQKTFAVQQPVQKFNELLNTFRGNGIAVVDLRLPLQKGVSTYSTCHSPNWERANLNPST